MGLHQQELLWRGMDIRMAALPVQGRTTVWSAVTFPKQWRQCCGEPNRLTTVKTTEILSTCMYRRVLRHLVHGAHGGKAESTKRSVMTTDVSASSQASSSELRSGGSEVFHLPSKDPSNKFRIKRQVSWADDLLGEHADMEEASANIGKMHIDGASPQDGCGEVFKALKTRM